MTLREPRSSAAVESTLGYLYQCRYALLIALRKVFEDPASSIVLERLDDVTFEAAGTPAELLQTKHHVSTQANLTDSSVDLWRSIRSWILALRSNTLEPTTVLALVTTASAPDGSAASMLREQNRDHYQACSLLKVVAQDSANETNKQAYELFEELDEEALDRFVSAIYVFDRAPAIQELGPLIEKELKWATERQYLSSLATRLEGWWLRRIIDHLTGSAGGRIEGQELENEISDLRTQFASDNLPIDQDLELPEGALQNNDERNFVHQLKLIAVNAKRIRFAIQDYYRAFAQRSRWLRDGLVLPGELGRYEQRLKEEWGRIFERLRESLGLEASEELKVAMGRDIYNEVPSIGV